MGEKFKSVLKYAGNWIEITVRNPDGNPGLFIAEARATGAGPDSTARFWAKLDLGAAVAFVDPDSARVAMEKDVRQYYDERPKLWKSD